MTSLIITIKETLGKCILPKGSSIEMHFLTLEVPFSELNMGYWGKKNKKLVEITGFIYINCLMPI